MYPRSLTAPPPHEDMPDDAKEIYEEARKVLIDSPRAATGLLRLVVQLVCDHLEGSGANINHFIAKWVEEGLDTRVQQALDSVRVTGNHALHAGEIDINSDPTIASRLFDIVNFIIEKKIGEPKRIDDFYNNIVPESDRDNIERRDN